MAKAVSRVIKANQVFLGLPWKTVKPKYEDAINQLHKKYPLYFHIVGRTDKHDADDLLDRIKQAIAASSYAIFDATGGNANVSLEFRFAEGIEVPRALFLCTHGRTRKVGDAPIISDLAGKKRNAYKTTSTLIDHLSSFANGHEYTKSFEHFLRTKFKRASKGAKRRNRSLALKIVHALDGHSFRRRADIVAELRQDANSYSEAEVGTMILKMHQSDLIESLQGPYSTVRVRTN